MNQTVLGVEVDFLYLRAGGEVAFPLATLFAPELFLIVKTDPHK